MVEHLQPTSSYPFTNTAQRRRNFILAKVPDARRRPMLEIGAFDNATFASDEATIRYADWLTKAELVRMHEKNPKRRAQLAVDVDYVLGERPLSEMVTEKFGLVIANHVIEHIPDIISWMRGLAQVTEPGGYLALTVPDQRYTFDIGREVTDAVEVLRCHLEGNTRPSVYQILRSKFYHQSVNPSDVWEGKVPARGARMRGNLKQLLTEAQRLSTSYHDVHCSVFTFESFKALWQDLLDAELVAWRVVATKDVAKPTNEFHVLLQNPR